MSSIATTPATPDTHIIWSIAKVRRYIGWIGFLFPLGLFFGHLFLDPPNHTLDAISDYRYSESMHLFLVVGVLALAVLLIYYQYEPVDTKMSTFAGLCAMGVALFPPALPNFCDAEPAAWQCRVDVVHHSCAVLFIGSLAVIVFFLFTRSTQTKTLLAVPFAQTRTSLADLAGRGGWARVEGALRPSNALYPLGITEQKHWRNQMYEGCGAVIASCLALCVAIDGFHVFKPPLTTVFWLETVAVWAFAGAWLIKGEALPFRCLQDQEEEGRRVDHAAAERCTDPVDTPSAGPLPNVHGNGADGSGRQIGSINVTLNLWPPPPA